MSDREREPEPFDQEWLELMRLAKSYGFSKEQVRAVLSALAPVADLPPCQEKEA